MTRLDIAPDLVEEAVFLALRAAAERGDARAVAWLEARERIYEQPDAATREQAFREHALEAFRRLHFDEPLRLALEACPSAALELDTLYVRRARRSKDESAELYCATDSAPKRGATRAVLALRPERFADVERLHLFVKRELLFVDDMLDEIFGYAPDALDRLELDPGQRDVVRERVSRAWSSRIEARARGERPATRFHELVEHAEASLRANSSDLEPAAAPVFDSAGTESGVR